MRPHVSRAGLLVPPVLTLLGLVGALPLLADIDGGVRDIFTPKDVFRVGPQPFTDILQSDRLLASPGRSHPLSAPALAIRLPLGIAVALLLLPVGKRAVRALILAADTRHWPGPVLAPSSCRPMPGCRPCLPSCPHPDGDRRQAHHRGDPGDARLSDRCGHGPGDDPAVAGPGGRLDPVRLQPPGAKVRLAGVGVGVGVREIPRPTGRLVEPRRARPRPAGPRRRRPRTGRGH